MKPIAMIYYLTTILYSVELRRYSPREENEYHLQDIAVTQDDGRIRTENLILLAGAGSRFPKMLTSELNDVTIYLYTRKNVETGESYKPNEADALMKSKVFDSKQPNYFVIHGWTGSHDSVICVSIKNAILQKTDMNVFVVDWKRPANWIYLLAKKSVCELGNFLGQFINDMISTFSLPASAFKLAGHSLGAHFAGCAGRKVNGKVDFIVAMDPASPLYKIGDPDRLNISAASFIQVIHTDVLYLGIESSLGHVDIYPNNGYTQPGCRATLSPSCSHARSYEYFAESIRSGGFTTIKCDSFEDYEAGKCRNNPNSYLGGLDIDKKASGDYYLVTNPQSPYSRN